MLNLKTNDYEKSNKIFEQFLLDEKQQYLLPIVGNTYWMIDAYGDVHRVQYRNDLLMNKMLHNCNLFPTKNDALEASFAAKNARIIVFNNLK